MILQMAQGFLDEHNAYRAEISRSNMDWDTELAKVSGALELFVISHESLL
jgi:hypothetical protein